MRRVFATVVIGHPAHLREVDARQVEQTLRTYNSHLSRVQVITWATLLESAERALVFEQEAAATVQDPPPPAPDPWAPTPPPAAQDPWAVKAPSAGQDPWAPTTTPDPWANPAPPANDAPPF